MYIWRIDGELFSVRLPSHPNVISMESNQVGITTTAGEAFIWSPISKLRQIPIVSVGLPVYNSAVMFHPSQATTIYIVSMSLAKFDPMNFILPVDKDSWIGDEVGRLTVQKYVGNKLITVKSTDICLGSLDSNLENMESAQSDNVLHSIPLCPRKADDNGTYALSYFKTQSNAFNNSECPERPSCMSHGKYDLPKRRRVIYITFNIFTENFDYRAFHSPPSTMQNSPPAKNDYHLWSDHLYNSVARFSKSGSQHEIPQAPFTRNMLIAIHPCANMELDDPDQYLKGIAMRARCVTGNGLESLRTSELDEKSRWNDLNIAYIWSGDSEPLADTKRMQQNGLNTTIEATNGFGEKDWMYAKNEDEADGDMITDALQDAEINDDIPTKGSLRRLKDFYTRTAGDGQFVVTFGRWSYVVWTFDPRIRFVATDCTFWLPQGDSSAVSP